MVFLSRESRVEPERQISCVKTAVGNIVYMRHVVSRRLSECQYFKCNLLAFQLLMTCPVWDQPLSGSDNIILQTSSKMLLSPHNKFKYNFYRRPTTIWRVCMCVFAVCCWFFQQILRNLLSGQQAFSHNLKCKLMPAHHTPRVDNIFGRAATAVAQPPIYI